jgi:O-antigen/teichoic acid export membrane protein
LRLSWRSVDRATLREVRGYSVNAFLAMVAGRVSFQTSAIVIGLFLAAPQVTYFALATRLVEFAKNLLRSATLTLTPAISSLEAKGDLASVRRVLLEATRAVLYVGLPIQAGLLVFGRPFLAVWMGDPAYAAWCGPALMILCGGLALAVAQSVAARVLYGVGRIGLFARMALVEAALNLGISLALVRDMGIEGVAVATAVPNALFCVFAIGYACRLVGIDVRTYLRRSVALPLTAATLLTAGWWAAQSTWPASGWGGLIALGAAGLACYASLVALLEEPVRRRILATLPRGSKARRNAPGVVGVPGL